MRFKCLLTVAILLATSAPPPACLAWSPCLQGAISLIAFESLPPRQRANLLNLLRRHPQYEEMIAPPAGSDPARWDEITIIRASTWADRIAGTKYDRPSWHFFHGRWKSGEEPVLPHPPFELPADAAAKPHELNLLQAVKLCHGIANDAAAPEADRAIATCWLMSLIAKQNQPLRLYSFQSGGALAEGDDHGRQILIGDTTLFDRVENFFPGGEDVEAVQELKDKLQSRDDWQEDFTFYSDHQNTVTNAELGLEFGVRRASTCYDHIRWKLTAALLTSRDAPLRLQDDGREWFNLAFWVPLWACEASGELSSVLQKAM